jgi:hypothetical protein
MVDVELSEMVPRDILLNILIHSVCNSSYSTAMYFACMLFRPAALLFMILAVISVCYTWLKGLQMVWSQLCTSHAFLILLACMECHVGIRVAKL